MALTVTQTGSEVVTEKLVFTALQDTPLSFPETEMELIVNDASNTFIFQHLPRLGTNDTFDFEVNSILKDYFSGEFLALTGANQTAIDNALVFVVFRQVDTSGAVGAAATPITFTVKNITQDTFEIEDFDLADYDCGDAGSATSKLLTSSPSPLPIGDLTSVHVSCLTTSYTGGTTPKQEWFIQTLLNGVLVATTNEAVTVPDRGISGFVTPAKFDISTYRFDFDSSTGIDEVRFYIRDIASPFTIRSETKIYKLRDDCEKTMTLSWLNELGAQDSYTFAGNINRVGKYTDSTFKRVRPVNPVSTDVGDLVYKSSYNYEYDLFSDRLPENNVEWLSKMLINKRAAIQKGGFLQQVPDLNGRLYNWYAIDRNTGGGDGTASGGIVNQSQTGWRVPSGTAGTNDVIVLDTFLGGLIGNSGGKLKSTDATYWNAPNTGANNATGFTAVGSGERSGSTGLFSNIKTTFTFMTHEDAGGGTFDRFILSNTNQGIGTGTQGKSYGQPLRLIRAAVGGENDGDFITSAYTGNDGKTYDAVVIGTQVWINKNLDESKYNDGVTIAEEQNSGTWSGSTSPSFCFYDNTQTLIPTTLSKYFPIVITTKESTLEDKFSPETLFRVKFRLANRRKGIK